MNFLQFKSLLMIIPILLSCTAKSQQIGDQINLKKKEEIKDTTKYLSQSELMHFVENAKILKVKSLLPSPFDTLIFNKVIAYDFNGSEEPYPSVINKRNNFYVPVILYQKELMFEDVQVLTELVTNNKTYGNVTAACFVPHLGFVFYKDNKVVYNIDICLDCNYLIATTEFPAETYHKMKFDDGTEYGQRGFSDYGKGKIIELCRRYGLDYGK